jgi:hypothetical protein
MLQVKRGNSKPVAVSRLRGVCTHSPSPVVVLSVNLTLLPAYVQSLSTPQPNPLLQTPTLNPNQTLTSNPNLKP